MPVALRLGVNKAAEELASVMVTPEVTSIEIAEFVTFKLSQLIVGLELLAHVAALTLWIYGANPSDRNKTI